MENLDNFLDLISDEDVFSIVNTLKIFGSLNLRILADLLNKSEATTLRIIRRALDKKFLVKDERESKKYRGHYYKITNFTKKLFKESSKINDSSFTEHPLADIKVLMRKVSGGIRSFTQWQSTMGKILSNYMNANIDKIIQTNDKGGVGDNIIMMQIPIQVSNLKEIEELHQIISDFGQNIKNFKDSDPKESSTTHLVSLSLFPIMEIHPLEEKRISYFIE